ncbi:MAG TPA: MFS transporter [Bacteroidetes bacterium]|nr:MFS transporter [Bacteroidota bacterium]
MLDIQKKLSNSFYAMLALPATAMGFALSVQISALSWILSTQYGLDIKDIGLVWAAGPLAGIIGQVIIGIVSDKVWFWDGRRRPFILIGGVLSALMLLALPNIGVISGALGIEAILGVAVTVTLTLDLAINVSFNPTRSIIADVTPEGRPRTRGYTWMQTISGTFGVLAYLIGALFGNMTLIYVGVGLVLAFSLIPPFFIKEPRYLKDDDDVDNADLVASAAGGSAQEAAEIRTHQQHIGVFEILKTIYPLWGFLIYSIYAFMERFDLVHIPNNIMEYSCAVLTVVLILKALLNKESGKSRDVAGLIGFQKVLAAHSFTWIGVQTMFIYLFAAVNERMPNMESAELGQIISWSFFSLNLVAAILPATLLEPMASKFGRVKTHMISLVLMALGYVGMLYFGTSSFILYGLMCVVGIGWAATISLPFAIMSQKIPKSKMGLYMGLFNLSVVLPQLVASLGVGEFINQSTDKGITFLVCAVTVGISAAAWALVKEPVDHDTTNPVLNSGH